MILSGFGQVLIQSLYLIGMIRIKNIARQFHSSFYVARPIIQISFMLLLTYNFLQNILVLVDPNVARVRFGDLSSNLRSAECFDRMGLSVYDSIDKVGICGQYIYGRSYLYLLDFLGLNQEDRLVFGVIQGLIIIALLFGFIILVSKFEGRNDYVYSTILLAPGTILLIERGNLDGVILILIALAIALIQFRLKPLAWVVIAISVLFKFYTLPLLFLFSLTFQSIRTRLLLISLSILVAFAVFQDIRLAGSYIPTGIFVTFGLLSTSKWINLYLEHITFIDFRFSTVSGALLGLFLISGMAFLVAKYSSISVRDSKNPNNFLTYIFYACSITFLSCYFAGLNYDYRLPFLGIALISMIPLIKLSGSIGPLTKCVSVIVFWAGTQFGLNNSSNQVLNVLVQSATDFLLLFLVSVLIVVLVHVYKASNRFLK